ncbi:metallophosphoesterase [Idiomarina sp. M1R2S28]|uniref:Metallophosphoesterase n=1 Tax=Idiomarina rhizosphaerae TaxID=2961572 RepID=A0A9X2JRI4_9GAMM|nr:metallophosphoesterase [Idiomarina rhizosphaerae]MCP1338234.1 metallophosphoesterase [Idiomarina rhizosphaerae]
MKCILSTILLALSVATAQVKAEDNNVPPVAFMPDIHFHDVYADFNDGSFKGLPNSQSHDHATIRTMQSQLHSTRLFNENYFALLAALDDAAKRGIKLIALPGDFSDDGQQVHLRGLQKILKHYQQKYDMSFFAAPGNHDPVRPFSRPAGKPDYLGVDGHPQRIFSKGAAECTGYEGKQAVIKTEHPLPTICTEEVQELGYNGVLSILGEHGFSPQPEYIYWETPFSDYSYEDYDLAKAKTSAELIARQYEICSNGSGGEFKAENAGNCAEITDASYLVEPVEGLWLLGIDANVYIPKAEADSELLSANDFQGSGNAGYNRVLSHKKHLLGWIKNVVKQAEKQGKALIAFSHFPMSEFYDGQSDAIADLFGESTFQLARKPGESVSKFLAETGLKVHVGGHMHMNDTGVTRSGERFLVNIQAPSLAAYVPAYKVLSSEKPGSLAVDTIVIKEVPRFDELFEHYQQEYDQLLSSNAEKLWDKRVLTAKNYREFTDWHIRELTRQRFLPNDWPADLRDWVFSLNGEQLLSLSQLTEQRSWPEAKAAGESLARSKGFQMSDFSQWTGFEFAVDFYRIRNAGRLALKDISESRLRQYQLLAVSLSELATEVKAPANVTQENDSKHSLAAALAHRFGPVLDIFLALQEGEPDDNFTIDWQSGELRP